MKHLVERVFAWVLALGGMGIGSLTGLRLVHTKGGFVSKFSVLHTPSKLLLLKALSAVPTSMKPSNASNRRSRTNVISSISKSGEFYSK